MRKILLLLALLGLLAFPAVAQDDEDSDEIETGSAYVRVAHFGVNVGPADVYINGSLRSFGEGREFGTISNWLVVSEGSFTIQVTPAGRPNTVIIEETELDLERESRTTIAVIGNAQEGDIVPQVIAQDYSELGEFSAKVTVFHAIPDAPAVDILNDGELLLGRLAFPGTLTLQDGGANDGVSDIVVPTGTYDLTVVPNGQSGPVVLDLSGTELEGGTFYFVVAYGTLDDPQVAVAATPQ